tara:strand:+ start:1354 stop:3612 length:2259 start_codon:yes stop_codon:yes gene_type:complete
MEDKYENFINNYTLDFEESKLGVKEDDNTYLEPHEPFIDEDDKKHYSNILRQNLKERDNYNLSDYFDNDNDNDNDNHEDFTVKNGDIIEGFGNYNIKLANVPENMRSYSSIWGSHHHPWKISHSRSAIDSYQAWSSKHNSVGQWIRIDLGKDVNIGGIMIQGRRNSSQHVRRFHIKLQKDNGQYIGMNVNRYSSYRGCFRDGGRRDLRYYIGPRSYGGCQWEAKRRNLRYFGLQYQRGSGGGDRAQCFVDNSYGRYGRHWNCSRSYGRYYGQAWSNTVYDTNPHMLQGKFYRTNVWAPAYSNAKKNVMFNKLEKARYVWIYPTQWHHHMSMRADVYVEKTPKFKLTVGKHGENSRSYSSVWANNRIGTYHARSTINSPQAWSAGRNRRGEWMMIDMGFDKKIGGVIIQGRNRSNQFVRTVNVYTKDSVNNEWSKQIIDGVANKTYNGTKRIQFNTLVLARWVKIEVLNWYNHISMRADVLLVDDNTKKIFDEKNKEHQKYIKIFEARYKEAKDKAKQYLDNIKNKNADKNKDFMKALYELEQIKGKLDNYKKGATEHRNDRIKLYSENMMMDKEQVNNYFNHLYNFHKDISRDMSLDKRSLKTGQEVVNRRKLKVMENNRILSDLSNILDTSRRHGEIMINSVNRRDGTFNYFRITALCLLILVFIYILKRFGLLNTKISLYISYTIITLFVGIILFRFFNDKDKLQYSYAEKKFNTETPKEEGNKIIRENRNNEISDEAKNELELIGDNIS